MDRAALDAARARGICIGGWVPLGRAAEDGRIPEHFTGLRETDTPDPAERTRLNVADSDATLIVSHAALRGGSELTLRVAEASSKPCLWLDLSVEPLEGAVERVRRWIDANGIAVLNVAGPRQSEDGEGYAATFALLSRLLDG